MKNVRFIVLELTDSVKQGGTLKLGGIFTGKFDENKGIVNFTDRNDVEWTFWNEDTCQVIEGLQEEFKPKKFIEKARAIQFAEEESKNRNCSLYVIQDKGTLWVDDSDFVRIHEKIVDAFHSGKRLNIVSH